MAWYEEWFDENYLKLYLHRDIADASTQIALILSKIKLSKKSSIIDIACGEGRHCQVLKERGLNPIGQDLSPTLIESGKEKYPELDLRLGDMRAIKGSYDLILSLFTSFGYFEHKDEHLKLLKKIYNSLNAKGFFWLDYLNPYYLGKKLVPQSKKTIKDLGIVTEKRYIKNDRVYKEIYIKTYENEEKNYIESVALYDKPQMIDMFKASGLSIIDCFGDYMGGPFYQNSPRQIYMCQKV